MVKKKKIIKRKYTKSANTKMHTKNKTKLSTKNTKNVRETQKKITTNKQLKNRSAVAQIKSSKIFVITTLIILLLILTITNIHTSTSNAQDEFTNSLVEYRKNIKHKDYDEIPLRIIVENSINTIIVPSRLKYGTWPISEKYANFGIESGYLDNPYGNVIMFAHARKNLFKNLKDIDIDDKITIIGTDSIYTYKVVKIEKILPNDVDKAKSAGDTNLSLFTCEGVYDQYRLLIKSVKISQEKLTNKEVT